MPPEARLPPTARLPASRALHGINKVLQDKSLIEELRKLNDESEFFDCNGPAVRERRAMTRANFDYIVSTEYNVTNVDEIWNLTTIIERSKLYIGTIPHFAKGKFGRITAYPLWHAKHALYWWAMRLIPDFVGIFGKWHSEITAHIHLVAVQFELATHKYEKHNITDSELSLFYDAILKSNTDVDNMKQHFVAWLLAYFTAVRPGSMTVCKGYEQGASLGLRDDRKTRPDDETLRWNDLKWVRYPHGIGVNVTFRFLKNARNAYSQKVVMACREFSLVPTLGSRIELDPSAHLFALAYSRGLFTQDLETLLGGDEQFITCLNARIVQLPVLLACGQDGILLDSPMRESALNPYLQDFCLKLGLYNRNTMYGFRRDALSDMQLRAGTEQARRLAGHKPNSEAIDAYTHRVMTDFDISAFRLQETGLDAEEMKEMWRQARVGLYRPPTAGQNLKTVLHERVEAQLIVRQDWQDLDQAVKDILSEIDDFLNLPPEDRFYGNRIVPEYQRLLVSKGAYELLDKLNKQLLHRKTRRKNVRTQVRKEELEKLRKEQEANLKMSSRAIKGNMGRGNLPRRLQNTRDSGPDTNLASITSNIISAAEIAAMDLHEEDCDDTELLEDVANQGNRMEPTEWEGLPESGSTAVQVDSGDTEQLREDCNIKKKIDARSAWIRMWIAKSSTELKARITRRDLTCILCALDPTCTVAQKTQKRSRADLDAHLKSSFHDREAQLTRAVKADPDGHIVCPGCGEEGFAKSTLLTHLEVMHPALMWIDEDGSESDG